MPRFFKLRIRERNRQVIRAGDTGDPELKIGRTIGGEAAFAFSGPRDQLKQDAVANVRLPGPQRQEEERPRSLT